MEILGTALLGAVAVMLLGRRRRNPASSSSSSSSSYSTGFCPSCDGKGKVLTEFPNTDTIWNGQGYETRHFSGTVSKWVNCYTCRGTGYTG